MNKIFREGMKDGLPIGLGYLAVSFSLGIAAKSAGIDPLQGFIASMTCIASAGEHALFTMIKNNAAYAELAVMTLVVNARYLLMSCALSQRFSEDTPLIHRIGVGTFVTDELFGIAIARPGHIQPMYTYGAAFVSVSLWSVGTSLGIIMGSVLPASVTSALSVAIYGMFLAIIIPPSKENPVVLSCVAAGFVLSFLSKNTGFLSSLSEGTVTIILTVIIASAAAILKPVKEENGNA